MRARASIGVAILLAFLPTGAEAVVGEPRLEGPDIEPITEPVVVVEAITDARWSCSGAMITRTITVPTASDGAWDRIILEVDALPDGDPWDRLLTAAIGGAEVLRGTTPRTDMTLRKDVTGYSALMPQGQETTVSLSIGSFVGAIDGRARLEFYDDEPTAALVARPAAAVVPSHYFVSTGGHGQYRDSEVTFPETAPGSATIDFHTTGHGGEEFWFQNGPIIDVPQQKVSGIRIFHLEVDGVEVGAVRAMPYVYALLGFGNENANTACVGPGTSSTGDTLHPLMWWTAQQAADRAGIHGGVGEIPQYRIVVTTPIIWPCSPARAPSGSCKRTAAASGTRACRSCSTDRCTPSRTNVGLCHGAEGTHSPTDRLAGSVALRRVHAAGPLRS